jgi:uncharacterized repeat protein (TIGR01451 family)
MITLPAMTRSGTSRLPSPPRPGSRPGRLLAMSLGGLALLALLPMNAQAQLPSMTVPPATQVAAGGFHTCALTTTGGVQCWGFNGTGQLGDGSTDDSRDPVTVSGLASGVVAITAGIHHTCALTTAGAVKCWGSSSGNDLYNTIPVTVSGLASGVAAVAAGSYHTCALTTAGGVKCWGSNVGGQLGDGSTDDSSTPVQVGGLTSGVAAIAAGNFHTCALLTAGGVECWGANYYGELGDGSNIDSHVPVAVIGLPGGATAIAAGNLHTCAVTLAGAVKCWGGNMDGELGNGSETASAVPLAVTGLDNGMVAVTAGFYHTCAMGMNGGVKCWGANYEGELGNGHSGVDLRSDVPVQVTGLTSGMVAISAGITHTCALTTAGAITCWGSNSDGDLGDGTVTNATTPVAVSAFSSGAASIATGNGHACALTSAGGITCWGANSQGQVGDGSTTARGNPVRVSGFIRGATAVAAGDYHSCALTAAGGVECWGSNNWGQLGDGSTTNRSAPVEVDGLAGDVAAITAGAAHTCALTTAGGVECWGDDHLGQLGDGSNGYRVTPVAVSGLGSGVAAITAGASDTCALTTTGGVLCWGFNGLGQLGDGSNVNSNVPVPVSGLASGVAAISAGSGHTCALTTAGGVLCWGWNYHGQLGDGSGLDSYTAVPVSGLASGVAAISAKANDSCALTTAGGVLCWGENGHGQLGDGGTDDSNIPVGVSGLASGVAAISTGYYHACILTTAGGLACWGQDNYGQLGDGGTDEQHVPVAIASIQSIAFAPPAGVAAGGMISLGATASGGGSVSFDSWTPDTCNIVGTTLYVSRPALCGVRASQAGGHLAQGGSVAAASQQLRLIRILPASGVGLASSASPAVFGQEVTFTATVSGVGPTGSVDFLDGATVLCANVPLAGSPATAACAPGALDIGSYALTAHYSGDSNNAPAISFTVTQVVDPAATTTSVSVPGSIVLGDSVTVTAGVAAIAPGAGTPTGSIDISDGSASCSITLPATSCTLTPTAAGASTVTASYGGDGNFGASSGATGLGVERIPADATLASSADPGEYGQTVTFTATVTGLDPTGNVDFRDGSATLCTGVALAGNPASASCASNTLAAGQHVIAAVYGGDAANTGAVTTATVTITPIAATVSLSDLVHDYDGAPHGATVTVDPAVAVAVTYDGNVTPPTHAGSYAVEAVVTAANYTGSASATLVIAPAAATVTMSDLTQTWDGAPHPVTVATDPPGLAVDVAYDGSATPPTSVGTWAVSATVSDPNHRGSASATLHIVPGAADAVAANGPVTFDGIAGEPLDGGLPSVRVTDAGGNPVEGVSVTFSADPDSGSLSGAVQTTGSDGIATLGGWTLGAEPGSNTLGASAAGVAGSLAFSASGSPPAAGMSVAIDDSRDYAQALHVLTYTITVSNDSGANETAIGVSDLLPAELDPASAAWQCVPVGGATCTAAGSGDLLDTIDLPAHGSAIYIMTARVAGGGSDTIVNTVEIDGAGGTLTDTDSTTIVVFRGGFESGDDGAQAPDRALPPVAPFGELDATGSIALEIDPAHLPAGIVTLAAARDASLRIEAIRIGDSIRLRLVTRIDGREQASAWSLLESPGVALGIGHDSDGQARVLLVGTARDLDLPLASDEPRMLDRRDY